MSDRWQTERELGALLLARGRANRKAVLSPETAIIIGSRMLTVGNLPTRDDVARILCTSKCADLCYACKGTANMVVRVYGESGVSR